MGRFSARAQEMGSVANAVIEPLETRIQLFRKQKFNTNQMQGRLDSQLISLLPEDRHAADLSSAPLVVVTGLLYRLLFLRTDCTSFLAGQNLASATKMLPCLKTTVLTSLG